MVPGPAVLCFSHGIPAGKLPGPSVWQTGALRMGKSISLLPGSELGQEPDQGAEAHRPTTVGAVSCGLLLPAVSSLTTGVGGGPGSFWGPTMPAG